MKSCIACGTPLESISGYCPTCGHPVDDSDDFAVQSSPSPSLEPGTPSVVHPYLPSHPAPLPPRTPMKRLIGITVILALAILAGAFYGGRQRIFHSSPIPPQTPATALVPAPTATSIPAPYGGTLVLNDPLRDNSLGYGWVEGSHQDGTCAFTDGAYHVSTPSTNSGYHCRAFPDFSNFAFEVQMMIMKGDSGGIDFRLDSVHNAKYEFFVRQDGMYALLVAQGTAILKTLIPPTSSSAVHQGLGQTNIIAVVAQGSTITLYANHQLLARVTDGTYSHGRIALVAAANITDGHPCTGYFAYPFQIRALMRAVLVLFLCHQRMR